MGGVGTSQGATRQPGPGVLYAQNLRALAGWQHVVAGREANQAVGIQRHELDAVQEIADAIFQRDAVDARKDRADREFQVGPPPPPVTGRF
jgi:hypothetical protein